VCFTGRTQVEAMLAVESQKGVSGMGDRRQRTGQRWTAMGLATRCWWTGTIALTTAAVLILAPASLADASSKTAAKSTTSTTAMSGSMPGMNMSGGPSGSSGAATSTKSPICSNVKHTTVMGNGMVMAPVPSTPPTAAQKAAAAKLVANTKASLAKFASLASATAAGYVPATNPSGYVVHYVNWKTVEGKDVLDPTNPSALVYANTVKGPLLLGAMYLGAGPCQPGPDIGGSLTDWHAHDDLCLSASHQVVGKTTASGTCTVGKHNTATLFMLHVWVAPSLASTHQFEADLTRAEIAPIIRTGQS
jgi:hypothetical protein